MFADDTEFIGKIRSLNPIEDQQLIQEDINRIADWCKEWQMFLNIEKCNIMKIGKRIPKVQYTITDPTIMVPIR